MLRLPICAFSARRAIGCVAAMLLLLGASTAQGVVRDIAPPKTIQPSGSPSDFVTLNGIAYFVASDEFGRELWRSDGTAQGTYRLKDVRPGKASSTPRNLTVAGNSVFFLAHVDGYGVELWATNGTAAGTRLMHDMQTARNGNSWLGPMVAYKKKLYFAAFGGSEGIELWESDGTPQGTKLFVDIYPGGGSSQPKDFAVMGGKLYFKAQRADVGAELFVSDGTVAGTKLVKDLYSGAFGSWPQHMTAAGGLLYFSATGPGRGRELYVSDGTSAGTKLVRDIRSGASSSTPLQFAAIGSRAVFVADDGVHGREPWISDGTKAGTKLLKDIVVGSGQSFVRSVRAIGGRLYFVAYERSSGSEPWVSDGTTAGTRLLKDVYKGANSSNPVAFIPAFGGVAFVAAQHDGWDLWKTNGTSAGTLRLRPTPKIDSRLAAPFGNNVLIAGSSAFGLELFRSNGTAATTTLVSDLYPAQGHSDPVAFVTLGKKLFFAPKGPQAGQEPWLSDGSRAGTKLVKDLRPGINGSMSKQDPYTAWKGEAYFVAWTAATGYELHRSDGTAAGTKLAADVYKGANGSLPRLLTGSGKHLFYVGSDGTNGRELVAFDGQKATVLPIRSGLASPNITEIEALGNRVFFSANDGTHGRELWVSDGSKAGTKLVVDLWPGPTYSSPTELTAFGTRLIYVAAGRLGGNDRELHISDGTAAGTKKIIDLWPGAAGSRPTRLTAVGNKVFFLAFGPKTGQELYVTDGTAAGTKLTKDINPGTASIDIKDMIGVNGRVFFFCNDGRHGYELWTSDGTAAGTFLVKDLMPKHGDGVVPGSLTRLTGTSLVVFAGMDGFDGLQAWRSDGRAAGTVQLGKIGPRPGSGATLIDDFTPIGQTLFVECDDGVLGRELWGIPLAKGGAAFVETYGRRCQGTNRLEPSIAANGLPTIGNRDFAIDVSNARANSVALLNIGAIPTQLALPGGCALALNFPFSMILSAPTDRNGFARAAFPIPNDTSLTGVRAYFQYFLFDRGAPLLGLLTLSDGLSVRLGT